MSSNGNGSAGPTKWSDSPLWARFAVLVGLGLAATAALLVALIVIGMLWQGMVRVWVIG